ncbi:gluconokinase [Kutzneria buriramensis]|uniref:Gluconokinase n=1 Tax=Kutzneria buriramensis TaxID=1045776 RepID=A0A3E0G833_9PSEU|nr:gluconokinase [Kutzneria buriramensis]
MWWNDRPDSAAIGVDIGSDHIAVVSVTEDCEVLDTTCLRYSFDATGGVAGLVDPDSVVDTAFTAVRQIALACAARGRHVSCLAFGASNEDAIIAVDEATMAMTPSISGAGMSVESWAWLIDAVAGGEITRSTGFPVHGGSTAARIAWFISHDNALRHASWCGLKDFVASRFYGRLVADLSGASAMGLLDRKSMGWSTAALSPLGLRPDQLPPLMRSEQSFPITEEAAELAGLDRSTAVVVGGSGACVAPLTMGLHRPDAAMVHPSLLGVLCALGDGPAESVPSTVGVGGCWLLAGRDVADLRAAGIGVGVIRVAAGMRDSQEVAMDIADSQGVPVEMSAVDEPVAVGAAVLGWYTVGVLPSLDATALMFPPDQVFYPRTGACQDS